MTIKQKIVVYFGLVFLLAIVLAIWGVFAFNGQADRAQFITQLSGVATLIVAGISALGGFHSARAGLPDLSGASIALEPLAMHGALTVSPQPDMVQSTALASVAPAVTLAPAAQAVNSPLVPAVQMSSAAPAAAAPAQATLQ